MILDEIAAYSAKRVEEAKKKVSIEDIRLAACNSPKGDFRFERVLNLPDMSFICELKKASPSKGIISGEFPYAKIAKEYEKAGADAISCLTEPKWFLGSDEIFQAVRKLSFLPMLRKDFTVDEYQIYEAKLLGADAVLLICALLDEKTISRYIEICEGLGISALVETHNEKEISSAVSAGARIIGVNNRNLKDFSVDLKNSARLRDKIPDSVIFVAESGVKTPLDIVMLKEAGANAVLIGEALMLAEDKSLTLKLFKEALK